jgi:predicted ATPase
LALTFLARVERLRGDSQTALEEAEKLIALSNEHGFPFFAQVGSLHRGGALADRGQLEEGIAELQAANQALLATGARLGSPWVLTLVADAHGKAGQPKEGLALVTGALELATDTHGREYEAEGHRVKGELLFAQSPPNEQEAEASFRRGLEVARRQSAKSWELRAATSLARLWRQQGRKDEARELLAPVYGWFTEGFDTRDLKEAKALLGELG